MSKPALFFDRDGILNIDKGYVYSISEFVWMEGAIDTIKYFNDAGYLTFVVTNQSGIGRGYYTEADMRVLHDWMQEELVKQGAHIDKFYHCPYHPEAALPEYKMVSPDRKPAPGMLLQAFDEFDIDKSKSFMIGDKLTDVQAAEAAGILGYIFRQGNLLDFVKHTLPFVG
ncbi:MAG: D-glycero-alpha-D-manno-heptose-1,7-bisphosphate 7-phosphatase [Alphaproteobacteria bacterium]